MPKHRVKHYEKIQHSESFASASSRSTRSILGGINASLVFHVKGKELIIHLHGGMRQRRRNLLDPPIPQIRLGTLRSAQLPTPIPRCGIRSLHHKLYYYGNSSSPRVLGPLICQDTSSEGFGISDQWYPNRSRPTSTTTQKSSFQ